RSKPPRDPRRAHCVARCGERRIATGSQRGRAMPVKMFNNFDDPSAFGFTRAFGVNGAGQIVGDYHNASVFHGFLLSQGTYVIIEDPFATQGTSAFGINNAGMVVGNYTTNTGSHGFLLSGVTYTTIDDPLATGGTSALGINDAGQVVGQYQNFG